jgi:hypothetical protein
VTDRDAAPDPVPVADRPRPVFSRFYAAISGRMDDEGLAALRTERLAPLSGTVVEVGARDGHNVARYPAAVTQVTAVEPEPRLRALARPAVADAPVPVPVPVRVGGARNRAGAAIARRQLRCRGAVPRAAFAGRPRCRACRDRQGAAAWRTARLLEHTRAQTRLLRAVQRLADATVWPLLTGGCHTATDPAGLIEAAGFTATASRRLRFPQSRVPQPATPHVLGLARLPG